MFPAPNPEAPGCASNCLDPVAAMDTVINPLKEFGKNSARLVNRCTKPDRKEFNKVCLRTSLGFIVMGFIGFFVKLIFIPINQIIVGGSSS